VGGRSGLLLPLLIPTKSKGEENERNNEQKD